MDPLDPPHIARPFGAYAHGIRVPLAGELIVTSGQLGLAADGTVPEETQAQAEICFANIAAILAEAGADQRHVLRLNAYVTDRADFPAYMAARDAWLGDVPVRPASTLMIVVGFTRPEFKVEVEALALRPG